MIVNATQNGWEIIYHRAHALLAAQLAGQWQRKNPPERLFETLAAISHHDDLEKEWEEYNLTVGGAPMDFTLSQEVSIERLTDLAKNARYRGRWVSLLISMHISRLHEPTRGKLPELDKFLDEQRQNQQRWREELGVEKAKVDAAYAFMQWCVDALRLVVRHRLSLILCQHELPADERFLEISLGPDHQRYDIMQYRNGLVTVQPWPFEDEQFTVNVEACDLFQVKFDSNSELTYALQQAPIKLLEWKFAKS
ncbi:DUF3891 family protein [Anabaena sp. CCY 0017]|uniref:DUF3891 family protein n=1 Tax=Anabaena sp. CCY 0017 TaxID=3103866 RepID=UPI0039C74313